VDLQRSLIKKISLPPCLSVFGGVIQCVIQNKKVELEKGKIFDLVGTFFGSQENGF